MTSKSTRDLRDPQKLGEALLEVAGEYEEPITLHLVYDRHKDLPSLVCVPDYDHGESLVTDTVRQYRLELKAAADAGDRHARDTLRGIPNDDPSAL